MNTRRSWLQVHYEDKDISTYLNVHLLSWSYTDNLSAQADDLQLELEDMSRRWISDWAPSTGAKLTAQVIRENWLPGVQRDTLRFGLFEIDELSTNSPPSVTSIKATSVPDSSALRGQQKHRAWEKARLSTVARDIATSARLRLLFDAQDEIQDRIEQTGETDLSFLMRLCSSSGLCLKITGSQIVIFDEAKYERTSPVLAITPDDPDTKSFSGRQSTTGLYRSCRVDYQKPDAKTPISYTFTPQKPPKTSRVLQVNEQVESVAQAQRLARSKLREANREAVTVDLTRVGDIRFVAGITVMLSGYGTFDGKYIVTQATHSGSGSGYETAVQLRKCLEGY